MQKYCEVIVYVITFQNNLLGDIYHSRPFLIKTLVSYILANQVWKLTALALADILCKLLLFSESVQCLNTAQCQLLNTLPC